MTVPNYTPKRQLGRVTKTLDRRKQEYEAAVKYKLYRPGKGLGRK